MRPDRKLILAAGLTLLAFLPTALPAQNVREVIGVNSELEEYLRFSQTVRPDGQSQWTIRGFSRTEEKSILDIGMHHPWENRTAFAKAKSNGDAAFGILPASASAIFNSAFPYGSNDGPVWAGKGLTTVLQVGAYAEWGGFSLTLAPVAFRAENSAFPLFPNGRAGRLQFADGQFSDVVDKPQRFGADAYQQISPGNSTLRFDGFGVTAGISSASQSWGPSDKYQFILGNNAGGYPHIFVGTQSPVNAGIGRVHARVVWGMLEQSAFSPVSGPQYFVDGVESGRKRFTAGIIASLQPRGVTGLELGAARFFHRAWPKDGLGSGDFTSLFQNIFKRGLPTEVSLPGSENTKGVRDNQLFSLFARWAVPGTGFEAYGEFGREDHSWDIRDFVVEPDHGGASRLVGLRKMWLNGYALRAEAINYEAPQLTRFRPEGAVYIHYVLRQGHTVKGQPLGADVGLGSGAASTIAVDHYTALGRTSIGWERSVAHERGSFYVTDIPRSEPPDVLHTISLETVRFRNALDLTGKLNLAMDLNRNFRSDVFNLNFQVGTAYHF